jgi:hypothetical protein
MTTLTDRYVAETLRGIPQKQRADIEAELRTLVADAIDDRLDSGTPPAEAESAVLTELGSPRRLAASYTDRPLALIGPDLYLDYLRALTVLLSTIVPLWFLLQGVTTFVAGSTALESFGSALVGAIETGVAIAFFVTLVFAIVERSRGVRARAKAAWHPSGLPEVRDRRGYFAELVGGSIFLVVIASVLLVLQADGSGPIEAGLWASGTFYVALFYAIVSISSHVLTWYTGASAATALATIVLGVLFAVPAVWLAASGRLLDTEFFAPGVAPVVTVVVISLVVLFAAMDSIDAISRAVRKR